MLQFSLNFVKLGDEWSAAVKRNVPCTISVSLKCSFYGSFSSISLGEGRVLELGKHRNWFFTTSQVFKSKIPWEMLAAVVFIKLPGPHCILGVFQDLVFRL